MVIWEKLTMVDRDKIGQITNRAVKMAPQADRLSLNMDISAAQFETLSAAMSCTVIVGYGISTITSPRPEKSPLHPLPLFFPHAPYFHGGSANMVRYFFIEYNALITGEVKRSPVD